LVVVSALVCVVAAMAFSLLAIPRYTASTQIIIDPTDLRVVDNSLRPSTEFSDSQIALVEDQVRVITSSTVLRRVVEKENLDKDPEFNGSRQSLTHSVSDAFYAIFGASGHLPTDMTPVIQATRALAKNVTAKREERTFVVDVGVTSRNPQKAARLADAVSAAFLEVSAQKRNEAARRAAHALKSRLGQLKASVETAEQQVEDFKKRNNIVAAVGQSVTEQQLVSAGARLSNIKNRVADAQSSYAQLLHAEQSGDVGAVPQALQSSTVMALRSQLADVMRREGNVAATFGPRHPEIAEMSAQERSIRTLLREELARIASVTKSDLDRARADQQAAEASFKGLEANVTAMNELSVRLDELERDAHADRTVYEAFLTRTRELDQQEQIDAANISVISPAQTPETRTWPPRPLYLIAAGLILGLALGFGLALARELLTPNRFRPVGSAWPIPVRS
jgi:uncharacterized protein involved in exopolysaccharide biosynthesis